MGQSSILTSLLLFLLAAIVLLYDLMTWEILFVKPYLIFINNIVDDYGTAVFLGWFVPVLLAFIIGATGARSPHN